MTRTSGGLMNSPHGPIPGGSDTLDEGVYPVQDGEPMGETDRHRDELQSYAVNVLLDHFREVPLVYVSGNNFLYYVQGDPRAVVSPDTYVVRGVEQRQRDTFKVWEERGHSPCFVLEITSKTTRRVDLGEKMSRYRDDLRVPEYFLFDPLTDWIEGQLRGFALDESGVYLPILANAQGRLESPELGLELAVSEGHLRFYPLGASRPLPTRAEQAEEEKVRADTAEERAEKAEERAEKAEEELRELRAEVARLRREGDA
jgi:Uma2 family endonuclease